MENNYLQNLKMLRQCERIYKLIFWAYFISCVPPAVMTLIYGTLALATRAGGSVLSFAVTMILLLVIFVSGLLSIYKKEPKFTYLPLPFTIILLFVNCFDDMFFLSVLTFNSMASTHFTIAVISSVMLTLTHKKYRYLEQQDGFPYFNERFEKNKNSLNDYNNNNPYQQSMERYKNASSGKMDDL